MPLLQPIPAAPQILADPPPAAPKKASEMEQAVVQAFSKRGMHGVLYPSKLGLIYLNGDHEARLFLLDVVRRKIQMPGVRRVVRSDLGAIPRTRTRHFQLHRLRRNRALLGRY